jgi:hypothetical protein
MALAYTGILPFSLGIFESGVNRCQGPPSINLWKWKQGDSKPINRLIYADFLVWRRGWDSDSLQILKPRNLLILHSAETSESARKSELRYKPGTRRRFLCLLQWVQKSRTIPLDTRPGQTIIA